MEYRTDTFVVRKLRQNEINDIFEISFADGREVDYLTFPRTMDMTCEEVAEWVEEEEK